MPSFREFGSVRHLAGRFFGALLPVGPRRDDERWAQEHLLEGERTLWRRMSGADRRHAVGVARRTVAELDEPSGQKAAGREDVAAPLAGREDVAAPLAGREDVAAPLAGREDVAAPLAGREDVAAPLAGREVVAAALLHDVGKIEAGLGTWARTGVTLAAMATSREHLVEWSGVGAASGDVALQPGAVRRAWRPRVGLYLRHDQVGAGLLASAGSDPLTVAWAAEHHQPPDRWSVDARLGAALKVADDD